MQAIASLLTLVGYSVNDNVVAYDRMRANTARHPDMSLRELIVLSTNQMLARPTFGTALLATQPMAILGGSAVQSFAIPMFFVIFAAALSSIFIAAPILLFLGDWRRRNQPGATVAAAEHSPT